MFPLGGASGTSAATRDVLRDAARAGSVPRAAGLDRARVAPQRSCATRGGSTGAYASTRPAALGAENLPPSLGTAYGASGRPLLPYPACAGGDAASRRPTAAAPWPAWYAAPLRDITNTFGTLPPPPLAPPAVAPVGAAARARAPGSAGRSRDAEAENAQTVAEYLNDTWERLFHKEAASMPRPEYMETQADLNGQMRSILVDWLSEVHWKYRLRPETLFLAVNLVDRHLSRSPVRRSRLQLVGVVAFLIAAKFEEVHPPTVESLAYITAGAYTVEDIVEMECKLLSSVNFEVMVPTSAHFMNGVEIAGMADAAWRDLASYMLELALVDMRMIRYEPSKLVAAALVLSGETLGKRHPWPTAMAQRFRHSRSTLKACVEDLRTVFEAAPGSSLQAVQKKYRHISSVHVPLGPTTYL